MTTLNSFFTKVRKHSRVGYILIKFLCWWKCEYLLCSPLQQVKLKIKITPISTLLTVSFSTLTSVILNEVFHFLVMWSFLN